jgi:alginate O-acetyltransferase complex protein AlgI
MSVSSLEFLLLLCLASAVFFQLPGTRSRQVAFAVCSGGFLCTYIPNYRSWIVLLGFLLSGFGCAKLLSARPSRAIFAVYVALLVLAFAVLRKYEFVKLCAPDEMLDLHVEIIGLSYILFRQIHFVVDVMQEQIQEPTLWAYLNYQLNPFTLLAGPIQRYQDFQGYWERPTPLLGDRHEILKAYLRLFAGVIKVVVISEAFHGGYNLLLGQLESSTGIGPGSGWKAILKLVLMLYLYLFYLYMNFSGYCDVVIAGASLVGLRLPENFHDPFLSRNILDYWSRWHITLGTWIRDYLFTPFYKAGAERFPGHYSAVAVVGYFVAFTLAGIWHGSTWSFLIYGLLHGAGASAAKLWENLIVKYAGRPGLRSYLKSPTIRRIATVATFHYACFTLFFFALDLGRGQQIVARLWKSFSLGN